MGTKKAKAAKPKSKAKPKAAKRAPAAKKAATKKKRTSGRPAIGGAGGGHQIGFKIPNADFVKAKKNAKTYANGRLSAWMRFAAVNAKPTGMALKALREATADADE